MPRVPPVMKARFPSSRRLKVKFLQKKPLRQNEAGRITKTCSLSWPQIKSRITRQRQPRKIL
jgi:hypothetical protein